MAKFCPLQFYGSMNGVWWYRAQKCVVNDVPTCNQGFTVSASRAHAIDNFCTECTGGTDCSDPIQNHSVTDETEWPTDSHIFMAFRQRRLVRPAAAVAGSPEPGPNGEMDPDWLYAGSADIYAALHEAVAHRRFNGTDYYFRIFEFPGTGGPPLRVGLEQRQRGHRALKEVVNVVDSDAAARRRHRLELDDGTVYHIYAVNQIV